MPEIDYQKILRRIKPSESEYSEVNDLAVNLISIINSVAANNNIDARAVLVGSVAKDTWLAGKADIDIFIEFPLNTEESELKDKGLFLGYECIKRMQGQYELRYASHPYVTGLINGFEIDFVPCYSIKDSSKLKSAVDRTILHTEYVKKKLEEEQKDDVILLKKFMESIETYGSEFKVGGFAGYLCELLVLYYGSFTQVLEAASDYWHYGYIIDLENFNTGSGFSDPLVVVDPVDKNRNVAAALTIQKMSEFIIASRNFLENPKEEFFSKKIIKYNVNLIKNGFNKRGTKTILLVFKPPEVPADAIFPQLKKTETSLKKIIERAGFQVYGSGYWTDQTNIAIILLEMLVWELPIIKKHAGPYIWSKKHQKRFLDKYGSNAWIENDQWMVDIERDYCDVESLLRDFLTPKNIKHLKSGKHVKEEILNHVEIVDIDHFINSIDDEDLLLKFLYEYINKSGNIWR
ncbi:MAG: CCA tRNA nucleotidyltransferase [Methanobacteriaceae archaeon]|nr:CCA tRNA nucleotidyltransferase [Methanobacteriaceae archaeon]